MGFLGRWRERRRQQAVKDLQQEVGLHINRVVESYTEADNTPPAQMDIGVVHLVRFGQHLHAMQTMLDILIATHPDAKWLKRTWDLNVTHMSDSLFDEPAPFGEEALREPMLEAWKEMIQHFTQVIDGAVKAHGHLQDDDHT